MGPTLALSILIIVKLRIRLRSLLRPVVRYLAFFHYNTYYHEGDGKLTLGHRVGQCNVLFNTASGDITVGDYTIFGYNTMILTGRHFFDGGKRVSLKDIDLTQAVLKEHLGWGGGPEEVPPRGFDINIGRSCFIASGAIITGGVTLGHGVLVCANAVVTKDVPDYAIVAGIPAKTIGSTMSDENPDTRLRA
ncbi:MAG: hypothetical protein GKR96_02040 [Gammaproteobacteria bacterium]|nr:hypothetical protein [Gammaproteobacteria bacterium]